MKTNYKNDAISFVKDEKGLAFGPNISVKDWYKRYQQGDKLEEILEEIANLVVRAERDAIPFKGIFNEDRYKGIIKDNLCLKLINTKQNQELLQNLPHKEFNDLSIICTFNLIFFSSLKISEAAQLYIKPLVVLTPPISLL